MEAMITALGGRLEKVVVDDLWNETYYAKLHLTVDSETVTVDARPSDAVALGLRAEASIFVTDTVMAASKRPESPSDPTAAEPDSGMEPQDPQGL
jgi:hypothetical protein